ncbi:uncharacterized protein [Trachinotus anak]|uniref:uncharacterized protein n=1 Tax=Trachinotus anak TaxID=443729 RepID=UPI0039F23FB0
MPPKTIKASIKRTLANLSEGKFGEFVEELLDRREEPCVTRNDVEGKTRIEVANVVVSAFTEARAPQVVAEILREIGCSDAAERLVEETGGQPSQPGSSGTAGPSPGAAGGNTGAADQHFVDRHQLALIDRVTNVAPILDELLAKKVIGRERYEEIRKLPTTYAKIREIYPSIEASDTCKDIFYEILTRHEKYLIEDIHKKNSVCLQSKEINQSHNNDQQCSVLNFPHIFLTAARSLAAATEVNTMGAKVSRTELFVAKHKEELIRSVTNVTPVLDELLSCDVINKRTYDEIMSIPDSEGKMRALFMGPLRSSGGQGKKIFFNILEAYEPHLINYLKRKEYENIMDKVPVATMTTKKQLVETLNKLSSEELEEFKSLIELEKGFPHSSRSRLKVANVQDVVELVVETYRQDSVEVTKKVLKEMNRTDLVQGWSDVSSGAKDKHPEHEQWPALIQRVETMVSVIELLLETLADLSNTQIEAFKQVLLSQIHHHRRYYDIKWRTMDLQDTVFLMVQTFGQQSAEMIKKVLKEMNRTELVRRLSDSSSGPTKKLSEDEHLSALIHKVATMAAVNELILETLTGLNYVDLEKFKWFLQLTCFQKGFPYIPWSRLEADSADLLVKVMVEMCGQQSVEVTRQVFMDMNRTDLVQRLSETSSGLKASGSSAEGSGVNTTEGEKDERCSALIQKEETMVSVIELLFETLADLSDRELWVFKQVLLQIHRHRPHPDIPWILLTLTDLQDTVFLMVQTYGQESVEKTKKVLKEMNRTDLVQRLTDSSSGPTKKLSVDERCSALIQKVATIAAVKQLLLENLNDLNNEELQEFKEVLRLSHSPWDTSFRWWMLSDIGDRADIVDLIVEIYGQQSVEVTKKFFIKMNKTDLVQRLSETSSGPKDKLSGDEHRAALFERVAAKDAAKHVLLETLNSLNLKDFNIFKWLLQFTYFQRGLPQLPQIQLVEADRAAMVDVVVEKFGQQSVEVIREVFTDMNRTDLVPRFSETSLQLRVKHLTSLLQKDLTMRSVQEKLLETLEELTFGELEEFKWLLQHKGIPRRRLEMADRVDIVDLMVQMYGEQFVEVTREVLMKMNRIDLEQRLSEISSGPRGSSRSLELEGCGSTMQESSDWTKLEPEVNSTDVDEAPTYSLQSEAGHFECSVSALRWVCKEKVSLKYQFFSWEGHMERMESRQYMAAGPLMNITVIAGKLDEVYLPHWICIDDNPTILDKFAVLHIDDCGDVVETVSEVTPSHVKLSEPVFSPRAVLVKAGFPVKTKSYVLIYYKPNIPSLKLHVYVIPKDPALQQTVDKTEISDQYEKLRKPHPDKYLKMKQAFTLTADVDTAKIIPKELTLMHESDPNFYEVFIENPDRIFNLTLSHSSSHEQVWTCEIRKDDYPNSGPLVVDDDLSELVQTATITTVREKLLKMLQCLKKEEFEEFKWYLQDSDVLSGLPSIPRCQLEETNMHYMLVDIMTQTYSQQSVEVSKSVFKKINRNDLVQLLSESSS